MSAPPDPPPLVSLTYVSSAVPPLEQDELASLLERARQRNEDLGVTGVLLHHEGNVIQNLEGTAEAVDELYASIAADRRHRGVIVLLREQVTARRFPDWSMGYRSMTPVQASGFTDFLDEPATGVESRSADDVHLLLEVFRENVR